MVKEIRIYIEGGGDGKNTKALIRQGFSSFLKEIVNIVKIKKIGWKIIICGSRNNAFRDFKKDPNVEKIDKDSLERSLKEATRNTKSKGEYQKIQHASDLLKHLDTHKVRKASHHCDRLFTTLAQIMGETI